MFCVILNYMYKGVMLIMRLKHTLACLDAINCLKIGDPVCIGVSYSSYSTKSDYYVRGNVQEIYADRLLINDDVIFYHNICKIESSPMADDLINYLELARSSEADSFIEQLKEGCCIEC